MTMNIVTTSPIHPATPSSADFDPRRVASQDEAAEKMFRYITQNNKTVHTPEKCQKLSSKFLSKNLINARKIETADIEKVPLRDAKEFNSIAAFFETLYKMMDVKPIFQKMFREYNAILAGGMPQKICFQATKNSTSSPEYSRTVQLNRFLENRGEKSDFDFYFNTEKDYNDALRYFCLYAAQLTTGSTPNVCIRFSRSSGYAATFHIQQNDNTIPVQLVHPSVQKVSLNTMRAEDCGIDPSTLTWDKPEDFSISTEEILFSFDFVNSMVGFNHEFLWKHKDCAEVNKAGKLHIHFLRKARHPTVERVQKYFNQGFISCFDEHDRETIVKFLLLEAARYPSLPTQMGQPDRSKTISMTSWLYFCVLCDDPSLLLLFSGLSKEKLVDNQYTDLHFSIKSILHMNMYGDKCTPVPKSVKVAELRDKILVCLKKAPFIEIDPTKLLQ